MKSAPVARQNSDLLSYQVCRLGIQFVLFTCKTGPMLRPVRPLVVLFSRFFRSRRDLLLENLALRVSVRGSHLDWEGLLQSAGRKVFVCAVNGSCNA